MWQGSTISKGERTPGPPGGAARLIVMDDEPEICAFIARVAERVGLESHAPASPEEFRASARQMRPDLIVLDLQMPDVDGIELLGQLADDGISVDMVLISGADRRILETAARLGRGKGLSIVDTLQKPILLERLLPLLKKYRRQPRNMEPAELVRAMERRELELYYQPKIDLSDPNAERIVGVEALVRWQHPRHGLVMPDAFIPMAEQCDLIVAMTDYVIDSALERLKRWSAIGMEIPVAVNLPPRFFTDLELPDRLAALARRHGVSPRLVILEATETSAMQDAGRAMEVFSRLRLKGFAIAIDDFGTGYSSLSKLHQMPFSELKIDREFIRDLAENRDSQAIVKSVIALAKAMELSICAEGIEDAAALAILRELGCDSGQGFYFSRAISHADLLARVDAGEAAAGAGHPARTPAGEGQDRSHLRLLPGGKPGSTGAADEPARDPQSARAG